MPHLQTNTCEHTNTACVFKNLCVMYSYYSCQGAGLSLVPRPSHCQVFKCLEYAKMEGESLVHFITWMRSVSTEGGGGAGSPNEGTSLRPLLVVFISSTGVLNVCKVKSVPLLVQNEERLWVMHPPTPPPSAYQVDTDIIHVIKWTRPSPFIFAYWKQ